MDNYKSQSNHREFERHGHKPAKLIFEAPDSKYFNIE